MEYQTKMTMETQIRKRPKIKCGKTRTIQDPSDLTNINDIVAKGRKTGMLVEPGTTGRRLATFGDFSNPQEFEEIQMRIAAVNQEFQTLPAEIREQFNNDPQELLKAVTDTDPEIIEALESIGLTSLIQKKEVESKPVEENPSVVQTETPPEEPNPAE